MDMLHVRGEHSDSWHLLTLCKLPAQDSSVHISMLDLLHFFYYEIFCIARFSVVLIKSRDHVKIIVEALAIVINIRGQ